MSDQHDEFYVGYDDTVPPRTARHMKLVVPALFIVAVLIAVAIVLAQRPFAPSTFEFTTVRDFEGIIQADPYPRLLVARPGKNEPRDEFSSYVLVAPGKHGADEATLGAANRGVKLKGKLIYRDGETMIELVPGTIEFIEPAPALSAVLVRAELGAVKLIGEIVDSKCYLGVMNPGEAKPHRACAIRCISGGIPPMLVVRNSDGRELHYLLIDAEGNPIGREILPYVGIPVEIEGEAHQTGPALFLRLSADAIRAL